VRNSVTTCYHQIAPPVSDCSCRKTNTKNIIGTSGVREILERIAEQPSYAHVRTVCIGGVNESNVQRVLFQSAAPTKSLDGVAIVSAIMAADDAEEAARSLLGLVKSPPPFGSSTEAKLDVGLVATIIKAVHDANPLSHNMTNLVVQNFAAAVALAVGASPIMSNYGHEAPDLCKLGGSLVINMGTVTPEGLENYLTALKAYNQVGQPVVFDPVGYVFRQTLPCSADD
jgi:thiamine-phosphate diphosphorylase / hydroxyethylthiazole kinase